MAIKDPRTSERYQPRWEFWVPVFIHYAETNFLNSLASFQVVTSSVEGTMTSETKVAWEKLIGCVLILESHVREMWREKDAEFEKAKARFHNFIHGDNIESLIAIEEATEYHHQILELFGRRGVLRFKPPRSFGRPHEA